ncbi:MAG: DUF3530 family protein [Gammaproteobacteria bacterium]|nr:DUF3530 family protein [Gammaproteobacteria bacterium]
MQTQRAIKVITMVFLCLYAVGLQASDRAKEKRWAEQIVNDLVNGQPQWLRADGHPFLAIYTPAAGSKPLGGVILLHGMGANPDWPQIIQPLRSELPDSGWTTLSLQMPVLPNDAPVKNYVPLFSEVPGRINAGIAFLRAQGIRNIVIIGHSLGSAMGAWYLASTKHPPIKAFVGIGMIASPVDPHLNTATSLEKITIPVLDIYGSEDLPGVLSSAKARATAAKKAGNRFYRQEQVPGADHFFNNQSPALVKRVRVWLQRHAVEKPKKPVAH